MRWWAARLLDDEAAGADVDGVDALDVALDVADLARAVPRSSGPRMPEAPSLGDAADAGKGLGEWAGDALDGLGSADEGAVVIIPVVAIFLIGAAILAGAGALAMLFFSWDVLLAVAVELAFSVAAVRVATRVEREGWLTAAVRLTWKPLLGALLCAVLLGATIDHFLPQADSLPEAVRALQRG